MSLVTRPSNVPPETTAAVVPSYVLAAMVTPPTVKDFGVSVTEF